MTRRWSIGAQDLPPKPPANCKRIIGREEGDHILTIPLLASNISSISLLLKISRTRQQIKAFLGRRVIYKEMGDCRYPLQDGSSQIFPAHECIGRWSLGELNLYDAIHPYKATDEQHASRGLISIHGSLLGDQASLHRHSHSNEDFSEGHDQRRYLGDDQQYKLKDGRTIVFPGLPLDYDIEASPIPNRRFSFDNKDEVTNYVAVHRPNSISPNDSDISSNIEACTEHRSENRTILRSTKACVFMIYLPCELPLQIPPQKLF